MMDEEAKLVERYGRERPFSVPEEYFCHLSERVLSQTSRKPQTSTVSLWSRVGVKIAVAASICALVGLGYGFLHHSASPKATPQVAIRKPTNETTVMPVVKIKQTVSTASVAGTISKTVEALAEPLAKEHKEKREMAKSVVPRKTLSNSSVKVIVETNTSQADALEETIDYLMMDAEDLYAMLDEE